MAKKENLTAQIPLRNAKIKRRKEQKTVFLLEYQGKVAIQKRPKTGLLANLYEFPNVEGKLNQEQIEEVLQTWDLQISNLEKVGTHHHIFSHVEWDMIGFKVTVTNINDVFIWAQKQEVWEKYAIPGAFSKFREKI